MGSFSLLMFLAAVIHQSTGLNFTLHRNSPPIKEEEQKKILENHNNIRRSVIPMASNMLKMEWSHEAASNAQKRADKCMIKVSEFSNRSIGGARCGENIFLSSFPVSWEDVILAWKLQKKNFIYGVGATEGDNHYLAYTQMIWYKSYQIGCAVSYCPNNVNKYVHVCQYCPAGNVLRALPTPYKKGVRCADCPYSCQDGLCRTMLSSLSLKHDDNVCPSFWKKIMTSG
ncbi:cysteine-rich venom protein TEL1-like isoform X2 [Macrotis lagotis]|uniref:cysteine-rich venom protein TEL1-like isoform X2 n=1 Tax=Macrotis lagotis TaxID=92651 RepID=UPI003D69DA75